MIVAVDPVRALLRVLHRSALACGADAALVHEETRSWASATFVGAQHRVAVTGTALDGWLAVLTDAEFDLPGHLVASVEVLPTRAGAVLTALLLESW